MIQRSWEKEKHEGGDSSVISVAHGTILGQRTSKGDQPMIDAIPKTEMPAEPGAARKRKILVVEDEFVNREILTAMLELEYEVINAVSGADAEAVLRRLAGEISLVLLDLNLPDRHGLDILREMKEDPRTAKIPVIVLT